MSASLGHDFSRVRVHTDAEADELNQQLQAKAFATGPDIFFRRGAYEPGSGSGRELIAHELSHVVQQRTGHVTAGPSGMTVRAVGGGVEQEAEVVGRGAINAGYEAGERSALRWCQVVAHKVDLRGYDEWGEVDKKERSA